MYSSQVIFFTSLMLVANAQLKNAMWWCETSNDCVGLQDGICYQEECVCPPGMQINDQRNGCIDVAPYIGSACQDDFQCQHLVTGYSCHSETKTCDCKDSFRYLHGRCWPAAGFGEACVSSGQCYDPLMPLSMECRNEVCNCKTDHYTREKGLCRKIASNLNDACILDQDCQIPSVSNAVCDLRYQVCVDGDITTIDVPTKDASVETPETKLTKREKRLSFERLIRSAPKMSVFGGKMADTESKMAEPRALEGGNCSNDEDCSNLGPAQCTNRQCVCLSGHFPNGKKSACGAELGMKVSDPKLCIGFAAQEVNGVCECPAGFFYQKYNRDCKKPARRLGDSCTDDYSCFTFGSSGRCSEPDALGIQKCYCDPATSIQNEEKQICELINKGIGDDCEDSIECPGTIECTDAKCSCAAGEIPNNAGTVCLAAELEHGESCEIDNQCKDPNGKCVEGKCSCKEGHFESDLVCRLGLGGTCAETEDCMVGDSVCSDSKKCECKDNFIPMENRQCLNLVSNQTEECSVDAQCWPAVGDNSTVSCNAGTCQCTADSHYRDKRCWKKTPLRDVCARSSQCYVANDVLRTECRNSICQCIIDFKEEVNPDTCSGALSTIGGKVPLLLLSAVIAKMIFGI